LQSDKQEQQHSHKKNFTLADPLESEQSPFNAVKQVEQPKDINYLKRMEIAEYLSLSHNPTDAASFVRPSTTSRDQEAPELIPESDFDQKRLYKELFPDRQVSTKQMMDIQRTARTSLRLRPGQQKQNLQERVD
jgi:hypothetical protein